MTKAHFKFRGRRPKAVFAAVLFATALGGLESSAMASSDLGTVFAAGLFTAESNPGDDGTIRPLDGDRLGFLQDGSWVEYADFDFGPHGATDLTLVGATPNELGTVKIYVDAPGTGGELIGFINVTDTGGWDDYQVFDSTRISNRVTGVHSLYFVFTGGFNIESFVFDAAPTRVDEQVAATTFTNESNVGDDTQIRVNGQVIDNLQNGNWVAFENFAFGADPASVTIEAASNGNTGSIDLFLDDPLNGVKVGTVNIDDTGAQNNFVPFSAAISAQAEGERDLYMVFSGGYAVRSFTFNKAGAGINVYPPVAGLEESPKYRFRVREAGSSHWQSPFAWFTDLPKFDPANENERGYYTSFIGGWSHTYTNFEMGADTPIEVEISALPGSGIDINSALVYPADRAQVAIVDGRAIVSLDNPALIAVDINGELSGSNAPRATEFGWNDEAFPFRTKVDGPDVGMHSVTIFANPYILDKPNPDDPNVFVVEPGTLPPVDGPWDTLYFKPGVHHLGTGQNNEWLLGDQHLLQSYTDYYIPGDAIVYGNLNDDDDAAVSRFIRVFGHGSLSGNRIAHPDHYPHETIAGNATNKFRMLDVRNARNSVYEGVTVVDQPHHGVYLNGRLLNATENYIKWVKIIGWRVNNDGVSAEGNGHILDSFVRTQDDGTYVRGMKIARTSYWSDVNGTSLRTSFITGDRGEDYPAGLPQQLVVEDIDILFARGVFGGRARDSFSVIGTPGGFSNATLPPDSPYRVNGETQNTGQHVVFRNITFSDPNPHRYLIGFSGLDSFGPGPEDDQYKMDDWAGVRFENISVASTPNFELPNRLVGSQFGGIRDFVLDNVTIAGEAVDQDYVDNLFVTNEFTSNFIFPVSEADTDGDGVGDSVDNCTLVGNADQRDTNGDGYGNACDADLNNDDVVNAVDLGLLRAAFFSNGSGLDADFNGDEVVNFVDLGVLRAAFFQPPGPG
ncbi:MAG: carbohydrate-binding protein, partial [Gammaproteobacteria bacterium]